MGARDVLWLQAVQLFDNDVEFHEELAVFLVRTTPVEIPAWGYGVFVERAKDRLFDWVGYSHVILDGVQPSQYEVKYANLVKFVIRIATSRFIFTVG